MNRIGLTMLLFCSNWMARADDSPWAAMTRADLQGIHDVLRENHPGAVDPENARFRQWLEDGLVQANRRAKDAGSLADYLRALEFYTNGFQDDHIGIGLNVSIQSEMWPGFVVKGTSAGDIKVVYAEADAGVPVGARLLSCDGHGLDEIMAERIDPYFWNPAIPHQRYDHVNELFHQDVEDPQARINTCKFSTGEISLKWRAADTNELQKILVGALSGPPILPRIVQMNGVWLISIPTFAYRSDAEVAQAHALVSELSEKSLALSKATVVFDVRGNGGGDSAWGEQIAEAFWGRSRVDRVEGQFDMTVDWRASKANLSMIEYNLKQELKAGLTESASEVATVRDAVQTALKNGQPYARVEARPKRSIESPLPRPDTGRVFLLTDGACKSACLDFADIVLRMPGVTHVGLPTGADAIYIDNTYVDLPTRLSGLGYSMKVFRNRVRKNNEWYVPTITWPGGEMTDDAVTRWIASLR